MSTIFTLLMVLIMIACVLLIIIIMAQNPKGGGLSGTFGGNSSAQFGVQRTNDFMEKATWTLGGIIVGLILIAVVITGKPNNVVKPGLNNAAKKETVNKSAPQTAPAQNTAKPLQTPAPTTK